MRSKPLFKLALKILIVLTKLVRGQMAFLWKSTSSRSRMKNASNQLPFGLNCTGNFLAALLNAFKKIKLGSSYRMSTCLAKHIDTQPLFI